MTEPAKTQGKAQAPIDLKTVGAAEALGGAEPSEPTPSYEGAPYNLPRAREAKRGQIAMWLIWTLVGVVALVVLTAVYTTLGCLKPGDQCVPKALDLAALRVVVELVLTPLVGLVGAVTGFYFGEKSEATPPPADENA